MTTKKKHSERLYLCILLAIWWSFFAFIADQPIYLCIILAPVGSILNIVAVRHNRGLMPIYIKGLPFLEEELEGDKTEDYYLTSDRRKIRLFYLCDIFYICMGYISIGDILCTIGLCGIAYLMLTVFIMPLLGIG